MTAPCPTLGFRVALELAPGLATHARDDLSRAWLALLDARGLSASGGGAAERREYVVTSEAAQATESDRDAVRGWLAAREELRAWRVGELEDLREHV